MITSGQLDINAQEAAAAEGAQAAVAEQAVQDGDAEPRSAEARRYRLRLRDTETALTETKTQLDGIQRQVIAGMVEAECQVSPEVLWAAGTNIADLVEADGSVNRDAVRLAGDAAAKALNVSKAPRAPKPDPRQGDPGGVARPNTWEAAFRG